MGWDTVIEADNKRKNVLNFVSESNRIEGIKGKPTKEEIGEFNRFMKLKSVTVEELEQFVRVYQPDAQLRDRVEVPGVRVGNHIAPNSGPQIRSDLNHLLFLVNDGGITPFQAHVAYETTHPFTDGNGRSGRMLWAWQMGMDRLSLGFLHMFYYQTLENSH